MKSSLKNFFLLFSIAIVLLLTTNSGNLFGQKIISPVPDTTPEIKQTDVPTPTLAKIAVPEIVNTDRKILIIGDSLILRGFGPRLEQDLSTLDNVKVIREGQYSTGLNRSDYFDWNKETLQLLEKHKPDSIVVMFGSNDGQAIVTKDGQSIQLYAPEWEDAYRARVKDFMDEISPKVRTVFWIGQPIPGNLDFTNKFTLFNRIYEEESKNYPNILYLNTWDRFAINGKFSQIVADDAGLMGTVKENDGVHLTAHGSRILSSFVISKIEELQ